MLRRAFWPLVGLGLVLVVLGVEPAYVFGPLLGLLIWRVGSSMFASLGARGTQATTSAPMPVDPRAERTTYWCGECGAEVLLLVRGTDVPPRHCGERMVERREVSRNALN